MSDMIASRLSKIKPSITIAISSKAREMKNSGIDVISLGIGEPDFDTPSHIKEYAIEAINKGKTKYTAVGGTDQLKEAIINKFNNYGDLSYQKNQVIVGGGAKQVLYNLFMATLNEGDEVIVPTPYWVSYPDMIKLAGAKPVIVKCDQSLKLKPSDLHEKITDKTKWIIINSPNNPSGVVYTKEDIIAITNFLKDYPHVGIIDDAIYEHITYHDNNPYVPIVEVASSMQDRIFTINGVSKAYAMTGWRIGYGVGNKDIVAAMTKVQSQSTSNPCSISQEAATHALVSSLNFLEERNTAFKERRDLLVEKLNNIPGISCEVPNGAFYVFPTCLGILGKTTDSGDIIQNDVDFCDYILTDAQVSMVPGSGFGADGYFRISYATDYNSLEEACNRIANSCKKLT